MRAVCKYAQIKLTTTLSLVDVAGSVLFLLTLLSSGYVKTYIHISITVDRELIVMHYEILVIQSNNIKQQHFNNFSY